MPQTTTNPADEIIATAMERIGNRLIETAAAAKPYSVLRTHCAIGAASIQFALNGPVEEYEIGAARELIREINDVIEVAPIRSRDELRRTRTKLESLIDLHEEQKANRPAQEAKDRISARVEARRAALAAKDEG